MRPALLLTAVALALALSGCSSPTIPTVPLKPVQIMPKNGGTNYIFEPTGEKR